MASCGIQLPTVQVSVKMASVFDWTYCHVSKILANKDTISKTVMKDETITANGTVIYDVKGRSKINIPGKYV